MNNVGDVSNVPGIAAYQGREVLGGTTYATSRSTTPNYHVDTHYVGHHGEASANIHQGYANDRFGDEFHGNHVYTDGHNIPLQYNTGNHSGGYSTMQPGTSRL